MRSRGEPGPAVTRGDGGQICVGIATRGRPQLLGAIVDLVRQQTLPPTRLIIACTSPADVAPLAAAADLHIVEGPPGLARQRNAILDRLPRGTEFVAFLDDDFVPHRDWLRSVVEAFRADPALACVTGNVIADGINGPGLAIDDALRLIERTSPPGQRGVIEGYSPYGCNMAFRWSAIQSLRFDERLVLYGWLEDKDFGARVAQRCGRLVKLGSAIGVHLGSKTGRVSGRRLGYSQVMNPYYMHRKGTMTAPDAARQVLRNVSANLAKSLASEPYIDRRGRLSGNLMAVGDILLGRCTPERAGQL
ncbi:MAG: glycosyltransferase [Ancalomicrobiaceae bacterium]|nr:glycosyltransferase [Ancalomicrobiaceae bacterium]